MRNRILPLIFGFLLFTNFSFSQVCGTYEGSLEEQIQKYPEFYKSLESKNTALYLEHNNALSKMTHLKTEGDKKIIPVVVHVIHNGGGANLSVAQIENGIGHLNANINGQAYNFLSVTPDPFAAVRGDLNVEFRLAKIDPLGNPTNGINRIKSELTNLTVTETLSRDRVKALSYWNSFQYLNIWVVQSMPAGPDPQADPALNGYAQFPYPNPNFGDNMSTDGVVIRAAVFAIGETITHEVGHWLGLRHTWGDSECGSDNIADTPIDREGTFDFNGTFPFHAGLSNPGGAGVWGCVVDSLNPAGEMYVNYMDYQSDGVQTMFTKGQDLVMNETLDGIYDAITNETDIGYREYMWSAENIAATGTADGYVSPSCSQQADFATTSGVSSICEGEQIVLKGNQSMFGNGNVTSFVWDFGNGDTDDSGANLLAHTYTSAGSYDVTLTVEYNETNETRAANLSDLDLDNASSYDSIIEMLIVQGTEVELNDMGAVNIIEITLDSLGIYWGLNDSSFFRGELEKVTYVAYYDNTCVSSVSKPGFITVNNTTSSSDASSYSYSFENESDLNGDWMLSQSTDITNQWSFNNVSNTLWKWQNGIAFDGSASIKVPAEDMFAGTSTEIISKAYDLSDLSEPAIKFSWSGASINTFPVNEVVVTYSDDCGESWKSLATIGAVETSNAGLHANSFKPADKSEWTDTIMFDRVGANALINDNIRFKIEYVVNGASNNFYLDKIIIGEEDDLMISESTNQSKISIFPNPANSSTKGITIALQNLENLNVDVSLINILGAEIGKLYSGNIVSNYQEIFIDEELSSLEEGVYFVKVINRGDVILTNKLLVVK